MGESAKIRHVVEPLMRGRTVLDLGCGDDKIVPWAVGVDDVSEHGMCPKAVDIRASIAPDATGDARLEVALIAAGKPPYDCVFSSHALEHVRAPVLETLRWWLGFAHLGGALLLYLPLEEAYVFDPNEPRRRNPAHAHLLTWQTTSWYVDQLALDGLVSVERAERRVEPPEYSSLWQLRRLR